KQQKDHPGFLCINLTHAINMILGTCFLIELKTIQKYIPNFKRETAEKYFGASNELQSAWWHTETKDDKHRLAFLNYLLTGKLPK
ncbi:MAG: hypothetical protein PHS34_09530, partial [Candidatus Omnitrophica bacterium]|nr:hypothetical protein [Candidatus Omnitrophota bacterium]